MIDNRPLVSGRTRIVLGDANVLYSRVLRDYLLYAAVEGLIEITWSSTILDEMAEHLIDNISGFNLEAATALKNGMNDTFPDALINPRQEDYSRLVDFKLPDEGDRHVIAAALAAEADVICTSNIKDFPSNVIDQFGFKVIAPDDFLYDLAERFPLDIATVHQAVIDGLQGATDESTIEALKRVGVFKTAAVIADILSR